jgi:hypothetical protein
MLECGEQMANLASLQFAWIILNSAGMRLSRIHRIGEEMTLLQDNPQLIAVARAAKRLGISSRL